VVYHAGPEEFDVFKRRYERDGVKSAEESAAINRFGKGIFFSSDPTVAEKFGGTVRGFFLNIRDLYHSYPGAADYFEGGMYDPETGEKWLDDDGNHIKIDKDFLPDEMAERHLQDSDDAITGVHVQGIYERIPSKGKPQPLADTWIVGSPYQIKSATGNRGTFDPNEASILKDKDAPYGEDLGEPGTDEDDSFDFGSNVEKSIDKNPEEYISIDFKDHLDGYMGALQGLVNQGEAGKKIADEETGDPIWWSSTYPEFMQDQGWTQKEVLSALSHSIKGEEMTEKQRTIVQAAVNQAVDMFYEDLQRWYPHLKGTQYDKAEASIRKAVDAFLSRYYTNQKLLKEEKEKADHATMITKSKYQWEKEKKKTETKAWLKGSEAVHSVQDPIIKKLQDDLESTAKQRDRLRETTYQLMGKEKTLNKEAKEKDETALNEIRKLNNKIERLKESLEKARKAKPRGMKKSTKALIRIATGQNLNDEVWLSEYKLLTEQIRREAMAARQAFAAGNKKGLLEARARYKMMQAQQRAMREIKRNTNKIIKDFKRVLKQTAEMTPEYADKIKLLLEDFDLAKMTGNTRLKLEAIREALVKNPDADIDERTLDTLKRLEKIPIRNISYPGLKAMHEAVMHFATLGKRGPTMKMAQVKVVRDSTLDRILKWEMKDARDVAKNMLDISYTTTKNAKTRLSKLRHYFTTHVAHTYESLVESISGPNSMTYRVLMREIKRGIQERDKIAYELEDEFMAAQEAFQKRHPEIKDLFGWLDEIVEFAGVKMNRNQALSFYRAFYDPETRQSIIDGGFGVWNNPDWKNRNTIYKIDGGKYTTSVAKLSRAEKEYADLSIPTIQVSGDLLADKFLEINGYAMPRVENGIYWRKEVMAITRGTTEEKEEITKTHVQHLSVFAGMTKQRTGSTNAIWLKPYTLAIQEIQNKAANYVGLREVIGNAAWLLDNPKFKSAIEMNYSPYALEELDKGLRDIVGLRTSMPIKGEAVWSWLRRTQTAAYLGWSHITAFKQLNGVAKYYTWGVNPGYLARALGLYLNPKTALDIKRLHREMSVEYRKRRESGYNVESANVIRQANQQGRKPNLFVRSMAKGFIPLQWLDIACVDVGMLAATHQALDAFKTGEIPDRMREALDLTNDAKIKNLKRLTPAEKMKLAYEWADWVTSRSQSQSVPEHMSGLQRGPETEKWLSMYMGEVQTILSGLARAYNMKQRCVPGANEFYIKTLLMYVIVSSLVDISGNALDAWTKGRKPDEVWAAILKSVFGYVPIVRDVASPTIDQLQGKKFWKSGRGMNVPLSNMVSETTNLVSNMFDLSSANTPKKSRKAWGDFFDSVARVTALGTGLPLIAGYSRPSQILNREEELRKTRAEERRRRAI